MPRTYYKLSGLGKLPPCAICAGAGQGPRAELQLTHGVRVWLCAYHRDPEFLRARAGRDLVASLGAVWRAAGCATTSRNAAVLAHQRRLQQAERCRGRPGSYAWPALRREAEARFGRGERPGPVGADLRRRCVGGPTCGPAPRTVRRWYAEGRWLAREQPRAGAESAPAPAPARTGPAAPAPPAGLGRLASAARPHPGGGADPDHDRGRAPAPGATPAGGRAPPA